MNQPAVRGQVMPSGAGRLQVVAGEVVTREEQQIARERQIALAWQQAKAEVADHGNALLAGLYVGTTAYFEEAFTKVDARTRVIQEDKAFAACERLNRDLAADLHTAFKQNFRNFAEQVAVTVDRFAPSVAMPPRIERVVEVRSVTFRDFLSGGIIVEHDRLLEDGP